MFEREFEEYKKEHQFYYEGKERFVYDVPEKQIFLDGAIIGYNKANEWHYVKDGDLPKNENLECLCIIRPMKEEGEPFESKDFRGVLYFRNGRFYLDEDDSNDWLKETNSDFTELVIAWKEIVLPKESE